MLLIWLLPEKFPWNYNKMSDKIKWNESKHKQDVIEADRWALLTWTTIQNTVETTLASTLHCGGRFCQVTPLTFSSDSDFFTDTLWNLLSLLKCFQGCLDLFCLLTCTCISCIHKETVTNAIQMSHHEAKPFDLSFKRLLSMQLHAATLIRQCTDPILTISYNIFLKFN